MEVAVASGRHYPQVAGKTAMGHIKRSWPADGEPSAATAYGDAVELNARTRTAVGMLRT